MLTCRVSLLHALNRAWTQKAYCHFILRYASIPSSEFQTQKIASWKAAIKIPFSFYNSFLFSHLRTTSCLIYFPGFETDITQILTLWSIIKSFTSYSKLAKEIVQYGMFPWCTIVLSEYNQFLILLHYNLY